MLWYWSAPNKLGRFYLGHFPSQLAREVLYLVLASIPPNRVIPPGREVL